MKILLLSLSLLSALTIAWVSNNLAQAASENTGAELGETSWQLVKFMGGDDRTLAPADKTKYTVAFGSDGRVNVRIDCNRGRGTWKSEGPHQLQFGPLALTRAMCPPAPLNERIPKDWPYVRSYIFNNGHLYLSLMADAGIYEFEPASTEEKVPAKLENTYWKLTGLGETPVSVVPGSQEPHFVLDAETHRVSGSGGCNRLASSYELNGDRLTVGPIAGTMMACPEGMEIETEFLRALGKAIKWKITGDRLNLFDAGGKLTASFEARHTK